MNTISATEAQNKIISLMDKIAEEHKPVRITGEKSNAVLLSEEDWNAIQETLYLLSIPNE
jgi:prevent-host-death family protein